MARITKADLETKIAEMKTIIKNFSDKIFELETKNNDYLVEIGCVSEELYNGLVKQVQLEVMLKEGYKRHLDQSKVENERLKAKIEDLITSNENQTNITDIDVHKLKNERRAGRKPIDAEIAEKILQLKKQGLSYRKIADMCYVSVGLISNIINNNT